MANISGTSGDDWLDGTEDDDKMEGVGGNDRLNGFGGDDHLQGGQGNDTLGGASGDDLIQGGKGDDRLNGDVGDDVLDGGEGSDRLFGGQGNDTLIGGKGADIISMKGAGSDVLVIGVNDSLVASADQVVNFTQGSDKISAAVSAFSSFISGNTTFLNLDFNGDGTYESQVQFNNAQITITASDFVS